MNHRGWDTFIQLCLQANDKEKLDSLLDLFLTPEEKDSIALRCLIVKELLRHEKPQREIAETLGVSIAKITRGSNELKRKDPKLIEFLQEELKNI